MDYVLARNDVAQRDMENLRLSYALDMNILTDEVKANRLPGSIDPARMAEALEQLALVYEFENEPVIETFFDASLPARAGGPHALTPVPPPVFSHRRRPLRDAGDETRDRHPSCAFGRDRLRPHPPPLVSGAVPH